MRPTIVMPPGFCRLLMGCLCLCGLSSRGGIAITRIDVDERALAVSARDLRCVAPVSIPSTARSVRFHFAEADSQGRPSARLRYKLEGCDEMWRDLPVKMRAILYFRDRSGQVVASREFPLSGETPGWRGDLEQSAFVARSESETAPERTASVRVSFQTHGGDIGMGLLGVDDVRVRIEPATGGPPGIFDLAVTAGTDLSHPLGTPDNWIREGSRAELAILLSRPTQTPHPILAIRDDDPRFFGNWATVNPIPAAPGDRVTLEWRTAHSLGSAGPGTADYPSLKPGSYFFRVAAVRATGEPIGEEASLPLIVAPPLAHRWELWVVLSALVAAATALLGRAAVQRRMQRRLVELERQQAMERERARIARDLHDNIGAGLTEIAMQSDWVCGDLEQGPTPDTRRRAERIRQSATELARSVDEIVWAVNPANDSLKHFANYLAQSTAHFLDAAGPRLRLDIPQDMPDFPLAGRVRHNLFLAVREALNNSVKHAQAGVLRLEVHADGDGLRIVVEDDGRGFDAAGPDRPGQGDGLMNMQRRMEGIGGAFRLIARPGGGTRVEFALGKEAPT